MSLEAGQGGCALGLDLGSVRIGLAVSDTLGITVRPLAPLARIGPRRDIRELVRIVRQHAVREVVVGLPLMLSGEEGDGARAARAFADRLRASLGSVEVQLWDERLTTAEAERTLIAADVRRDRRRKVVDGMAASLILQSYLESRCR